MEILKCIYVPSMYGTYSFSVWISLIGSEGISIEYPQWVVRWQDCKLAVLNAIIIGLALNQLCAWRSLPFIKSGVHEPWKSTQSKHKMPYIMNSIPFTFSAFQHMPQPSFNGWVDMDIHFPHCFWRHSQATNYMFHIQQTQSWNILWMEYSTWTH